MNVSKSEFKKYEKARQSGATNMFDTPKVQVLSGLSTSKISTIMKKYSELNKKWPDIRKTNLWKHKKKPEFRMVLKY